MMSKLKGFWIPIELMDLEISWTKRILLAEINQLEMLDAGCVASNAHFSEKLKLTKQAISKALNEMSKDGLIEIDNVQTKRNFGRKITINFGKSAINFSRGGVHESGESKDNNPSNKQVSLLSKEKSEAEIEFDEVWKQYLDALRGNRSNTDSRAKCKKKFIKCYDAIKKRFDADDEMIFDYLFDYLSSDWNKNDNGQAYIKKLESRLIPEDMIYDIEEKIEAGEL